MRIEFFSDQKVRVDQSGRVCVNDLLQKDAFYLENPEIELSDISSKCGSKINQDGILWCDPRKLRNALRVDDADASSKTEIQKMRNWLCRLEKPTT